VLTALFAQHPNSKKQHSRNYKVKTIQVEDEIIDIRWLVNFSMLLSLGGSGVRPLLFDKFL
jgi:hypothetical protein